MFIWDEISNFFRTKFTKAVSGGWYLLFGGGIENFLLK